MQKYFSLISIYLTFFKIEIVNDNNNDNVLLQEWQVNDKNVLL